jgi:hypothetical protein
VVSKSLQDAPWGEHGRATVLNGELADTVGELKRQPGKNIGVHGSPTLVEGLLHAESRITGNGVAILTYKRTTG